MADCHLELGAAISTHFDVIVIGGGPSGSSAAIELARGGMNVAIVEKKSFPREVMCGEFLSHEVAAAIREFGLYNEFISLHPNKITAFILTPENGVQTVQPLGFEAWSLKRSLLDQMLLRRAEVCGATVIQPAEVISIKKAQDGYEVGCRSLMGQRCLSATNVIAAYGRQNPLDKSLERSFVTLRSGMSGVKYHVPMRAFAEFPDGAIQLFLGNGIYCGVNRVDENEATLCFLADSRKHPSHTTNALAVLLRNNGSFRRLIHGDLISELSALSPYGTGNIFFGGRNVVENGIYMIGDAATVIAPLAGDGIGMAIESGQLIASVLKRAKHDSMDRNQTKTMYMREWSHKFRKRLAVASYLQRVVMKSIGGNLGGRLLNAFPQLGEALVQRTRK